MKKSVFIIMLILVAVLSVCGNRNGGVKLTDEQLAERVVEDEFPGENLEIKVKESEDKDFVGYDVYDQDGNIKCGGSFRREFYANKYAKTK